MYVKLDTFNIEEQYIINKAIQNEDKKNFSKEKMLEVINFVLDGNTDNLIADTYTILKEKITGLTIEEWQELLLYVPFPIPFDEEI